MLRAAKPREGEVNRYSTIGAKANMSKVKRDEEIMARLGRPVTIRPFKYQARRKNNDYADMGKRWIRGMDFISTWMPSKF